MDHFEKYGHFQISKTVVTGRVRRSFDEFGTAIAMALDVPNECC